MKPAARAQGKGIFLFRKLQDITAWRRVTNELQTVSLLYVDLLAGRIHDSV